MARNGSGTYYAPAGNPVVTGTVITAVAFNSTVSDIGNELTNSLARDGQAPMTASLKLIDGSVTLPALTFNSETTTGIYRPLANNIAITVGSIEILRANSTGRVLIGTSTDDGINKLQVNGPISATSVVTQTINGGQLAGLRNIILNGAGKVSQRAGAGGTPITTGPSYVSVDMWATYQQGTATATFGQSGTGIPPGFYSQMALNRNNTASTTGVIAAQQVIESVNAVSLQGLTVTLSFLARAGSNFSAAGSLIRVYLVSGTADDQGSLALTNGSWVGQTNLINTTQVISTTYTKYSFTAVVPSTARELGVNISFNPTGTAGGDDTLYFTGVQLEVGPVATPFEQRPYGLELSLCQRYFVKAAIQGMGVGANSLTPTRQFPISMRAIPSIIWSGALRDSLVGTVCTPNTPIAGCYDVNGIAWFGASSFDNAIIVGHPYDAGAGGVYAASAEL